MRNLITEVMGAAFGAAMPKPVGAAPRSCLTGVWFFGQPMPKVKVLGGVSRGKGGKRAHKPTGIAAQRREARKARNRARA